MTCLPTEAFQQSPDNPRSVSVRQETGLLCFQPPFHPAARTWNQEAARWMEPSQDCILRRISQCETRNCTKCYEGGEAARQNGGNGAGHTMNPPITIVRELL